MNILIEKQYASQLNIIDKLYLSQVSEDVLCNLIHHDLVWDVYFETVEIV